jgi:hypothetical protein
MVDCAHELALAPAAHETFSSSEVAAMKHAALGVQMHSGWGVLVAVSTDPLEVLGRRRIVTAAPDTPGAVQPYHFAVRLAVSEQEQHLADCAASSARLAAAAIAEFAGELEGRQTSVVGAAVLAASGRPLPSLEKILAAHPLIHTAEGEFFRHTVRIAFADLKIPVIVIRERELGDRARLVFGERADRLERALAEIGREIGPPWTKDHKSAALAAALVSAGYR